MSSKAQQILKERLKAELDSSGLDEGRFAAMIGVSRQELINILKGRANPKLSTLELIAKALDIELWELFRPCA